MINTVTLVHLHSLCPQTLTLYKSGYWICVSSYPSYSLKMLYPAVVVKLCANFKSFVNNNKARNIPFSSIRYTIPKYANTWRYVRSPHGHLIFLSKRSRQNHDNLAWMQFPTLFGPCKASYRLISEKSAHWVLIIPDLQLAWKCGFVAKRFRQLRFPILTGVRWMHKHLSNTWGSL